MFIGTIRKSPCLFGLLYLLVSLASLYAAGQEPLSAESAQAAEQAAEEEKSFVQIAPVVLDGVPLFSVRGVSAYPAGKRAEDIAGRIRHVSADRINSPQSLRLEETPVGTRILLDKQYIMNVLDSDARIEGVHRQVLAQIYLSRIGEAQSASDCCQK